jgi:hypothetical protein
LKEHWPEIKNYNVAAKTISIAKFLNAMHDKKFKEFLFDQVFTENNSGMND